MERIRFGQRGVALVVSLILLLIVTVAALSAVRFSSMELLIARNDEYRFGAYHGAQSLVDATIAVGVPATGNDGIVTCTLSTLTGCSGAQTLSLPTAIASSSDVSNGYVQVIVRQVAHDKPTGRKLSNSGKNVRAGRWVITATYNQSGSGAGSTQVNQGYYNEYAVGEEVTTGSVD